MLKLKSLRESRGLNMRETAKLLKIPYTTYVNYEKGQREPTSEMLIEFADFFDVTTDYLLGREIPPTDTEPSATNVFCSGVPLSTVSCDTHFTESEISLIEKFRCLDVRGQAAVLNVLNHEYDSLPGEKANPTPKEA